MRIVSIASGGADLEAEERHGNDFEILHSENQRCEDE